MAKYVKEKKKNKSPRKIVLLVVLILLLALVIWAAMLFDWNEIPELEQDAQTGDAVSGEQVQQGGSELEVYTQDYISLQGGLLIKGIADYAGPYMEDGSDEVVTDVMMILLENTGEQDLQLARVSIVYGDLTAEFEVTNLPAGETVVALERNRISMPAEAYQDIQVRNVVFFEESMNLKEGMLEVTGGNGYLDVKNISGEDISGTIRLFYKNSATDLFYGGITYMAPVTDGIPAGETVRVLTGHYSEGNSRIVNITIGA